MGRTREKMSSPVLALLATVLVAMGALGPVEAADADLIRVRFKDGVSDSPGCAKTELLLDHLSESSGAGDLRAVELHIQPSVQGSTTEAALASSIDPASVSYFSASTQQDGSITLVLIMKSSISGGAGTHLFDLTTCFQEEGQSGVGFTSGATESRVLLEAGWGTPLWQPEGGNGEWAEPAPTEASPLSSSSETEASSEGGAGAEGGTEGLSEFDPVPSGLYCDYEPRGTQQEVPSGATVYVVSAPGTLADIEAAFATAVSSNAFSMVRVEAGVYSGTQLTLDTTNMTAEVIIASYGGPAFKSTWPFSVDNGVTLTCSPPAGSPYGVVITGSPASPGALLNFGWTMAIDTEQAPPDYSTTEAYDRFWRGFEVESTLGGVLVDTNCPVRVRGNFLHREAAGVGGAGLMSSGRSELHVFVNEIAEWTDSGIHLEWQNGQASTAIVARNHIHHNSADFGGGIRASGHNLELCNNFIYQNAGDQGGGVYYRFEEDFDSRRLLWMYENRIERNYPLQGASGAYYGSGAAIFADFTVYGELDPIPEPWDFGIVNNEFLQNGETPDETFWPSAGGGFLLTSQLPPDSLGPFRDYPGHEGQLVTGNTVIGNVADDWGGGMHITLAQGGLATFPYSLRIEHNTVVDNVLRFSFAPPFLEQGAGLLLYDGPDYTEGSGGYIHGNLSLSGNTGDRNWYVTKPVGYNPWSFSRLADSTALSPADILTGGVGNGTGTAIFADSEGHQANTSAQTLDLGNPDLALLYSVSFYQGEDFDRDARVYNGSIDIGADEYADPEFKRGECNGDNTGINIADAIFLLNWLFVPGALEPPCELGCDVNDDNGVNVADAIYLLNALFNGGAPPPSPNPNCGVDPTPSYNIGCRSPYCP